MKVSVLCLLLFLAGCGAKVNRTPVRIANVGIGLQTWCMPVPLADTLGYFRDEGLDVTIENLPSGAKAGQALMGGSAEVADFIYEHNLQMAAEGEHLRTFFVITAGFDTRVLAVSASASKRIRRAEDLRGASVGVPSPGSGGHLWVKHFLQLHGLSPGDYSVVGIGMSATALAALENGRVDAAALNGGDHFRLLGRHPDARILTDTSTTEGARESFGTNSVVTGTLTAKQEWLDRNGETARHLTSALRRTLEWIDSHSPEEIRAKLPDGLRSPDAAMDLKIIDWGKKGYTKDGAMPADAPETMKRYLDSVIDKVRDSKIDLAATWTNEYLRQTK